MSDPQPEFNRLNRLVETLENEAHTWRNATQVLLETNENLREALEILGCPVNHQVVEEARRLKRERDAGGMPG